MKELNKRATLSTRALVSLMAMAAVLAGCATSSSGPTEALTQPEVTVKWLPPCSTNIDEPYFSVDVFADGAVRYVGGEQAREIGERQIRIDTERSQILINAVRRSERGSKRPIPIQKGESFPEYCLEISQLKNGSSSVIKGEGTQRRMQGVIRTFVELIDENNWACPARNDALVHGRNGLGAIHFCSKKDNEVAFAFSLFDQTGCVLYSLWVYPDVVHYWATGFSPVGRRYAQPSKILAQEYYAIDESQFGSLLDTIRMLDLVEDPPLDDIGPPSDKRFYSGSNPEDVLRLKSAFDQMFKINWAPVPPGETNCGESESSGGYHLNHPYSPLVKD